ncbi:MAG: hypothetical protein Q8M02_06065 [Candidatus Didemnitutus sp.]|nr:hypothetical protein [Candidatus Didemnitutus sp.]
MSKSSPHPVIVIGLGLAAGMSAGLFWFWRSGEVIAQHHAATLVVDVKKAAPPGWDFWTIEVENLTSELKGEKDRLTKYSESLDLRAARLAAEQLELHKMRTDLERIRKEISSQIIEIRADESKNLKMLAATYANLTPRAAVAIIRELDDSLAVKILVQMKPDVVSPIFEEMSRTATFDATLAKRVAILSEKLRVMKAAKPGSS